MKKMEAMVIEPIRAFLSGELRPFKVSNMGSCLSTPHLILVQWRTI
jgi:hypothetical protein